MPYAVEMRLGVQVPMRDGVHMTPRVRARYRESMTAPTLLTPNQIYPYEINVGVTGNVFRQGHRIRLEVSSSNFPRFDRNLNTGGVFGQESELRSAQQTIYHEKAYPSHLVLPVIRSMT
jgi:uncharacterized protein